MTILDGGQETWHKSLAREPPPSDARCPGPPTSQGLPHTPTGTAVERPPLSRLHACLYVSRVPPRQRMAFGSSYPFATKPCGLSDVLQRFQAPVLDPQQQPPAAERSRGDKAAYGEQIQQKCHRVEQRSGRAETLATSHPVRRSDSEELGGFPLACPAWRNVKAQRKKRRGGAAPGKWNRTKAIST